MDRRLGGLKGYLLGWVWGYRRVQGSNGAGEAAFSSPLGPNTASLTLSEHWEDPGRLEPPLPLSLYPLPGDILVVTRSVRVPLVGMPGVLLNISPAALSGPFTVNSAVAEGPCCGPEAGSPRARCTWICADCSPAVTALGPHRWRG